MNCPQCGEEMLRIIGSAYDDDEYVGDAVECLECDWQGVTYFGEDTTGITPKGYSVKPD